MEVAFRMACATTTAPPSARTQQLVVPAPEANQTSRPETKPKRSPCPARPPYASIVDVPDSTLRDLVAWNRGDDILRSDAELVSLMAEQLGFQRIGARIRARLEEALK